MRIAYLECFAGAAGDMLLGACVDAGVSLADLEKELAALALPGYALRAEKVRRQSIAGTHITVSLEGGRAPLRHLPDIEELVRGAAWKRSLEERVLTAFRALAAAEAAVHGVPVEQIHFHEVGAVDAIVDICGTVLAFDMLGVDRVYGSEVIVGSGFVECAHGTMPVPAPGTLELLKGIPMRTGDLAGERCTPTGAVLLRTLVDEFTAPKGLQPESIGYGAGTRDDGPVPNLLRITVGEVPDPRGADAVWELSLQVDNVSGEVLGHALRAVLTRGALDVWATPSLTKKNRPAHWVVALCEEGQRDAVETCLLTELPTLGLRRSRVERRTLPRRIEERETPLGRVRFKVRTLPDGVQLAHPESDDVERLARDLGMPVPAVLAKIQSTI